MWISIQKYNCLKCKTHYRMMPLTCHYFTKNTNSSDSHFTSGNPRPRYGILWKRPSVNSRHAHIRRQWHSATEHLMHNVKYQKIIIFIDVISISRCISQKQSCTLSLNIVYTGNRCMAALFYSPVDSPMHETCIRVMHVWCIGEINRWIKQRSHA